MFMPESFIKLIPAKSPERSHLTDRLTDEHRSIKEEKDGGRDGENVSVV